MYYDNNQNLGAIDLAQIASDTAKFGTQIGSAAQYASSPVVGQQVNRVIDDLEMYTYANMALTFLSAASVFGLFLIALHKHVRDKQ
jgi:hypothetical protein